MSDKKPDYIIQGESLAEAALRKVFEFGINPGPEKNSESDTRPLSKNHVGEGLKGKPLDTDAIGDRISIPIRPGKIPFKAEDYVNDGKRHLLLACSGSVASIKLPKMVENLSPHSGLLSIRIVLTSSAAQFLQGQADEQPSWQSLALVPGVDGIYLDADEWAVPWTRGAPILHIELRRWADLLVVAPLSANTLAKMVNGICNDLLSNVLRCWDTQAVMRYAAEEQTVGSELQLPNTSNQIIRSQETGTEKSTAPVQPTNRRKLIMVAPAMNTAMWQHPITGSQLRTLQHDWHWVKVLVPTEKALACGDVGVGAMKEWSEIVDDIEDALELRQQTPMREISSNSSV